MKIDIHSRGSKCHVFVDGYEIKQVVSVSFEQSVENPIPLVMLKLAPLEELNITAEGANGECPRLQVERESDPFREVDELAACCRQQPCVHPGAGPCDRPAATPPADDVPIRFVVVDDVIERVLKS